MKKIKIINIHKNTLIILGFIFLIVLGLIANEDFFTTSSRPLNKISVVIDCGHGGVDVNIRHKVFLKFFKKKYHTLF